MVQRTCVEAQILTVVARANEVKWDRDNAIFADLLLSADEPEDEPELDPSIMKNPVKGIPIGPPLQTSPFWIPKCSKMRSIPCLPGYASPL